MGDLLDRKLETTFFKNEDLLGIDGFDEAALGVASRCGMDILVYDYNKIVEILEKRDGMNYQDASDYINYNIIGAYMGEATPMVLTPFQIEENEINDV